VTPRSPEELSGAGVRLLDGPVLDRLSAEARERPRRRLNLNLHALDDRVHRLLNAVEPGSYVRPHRHFAPPKDETLVVVRGALGLVLFGADGRVEATRLLRADAAGAFGADLRAGVVHSFVALESGTVFFEVKEGPYAAPAGEDLPAWAPAEGDPAAAAFEAELRGLFAVPPA
jgi:cupin fold WbuC family metalloprotein